MVHTLPDYSTKYKLASVFGQIDTGELAARLGSIVTHDRRGNVIWLDDFEGSALRWEMYTAGTGGAIALSTTCQRSGDQSCKCTTPTAAGFFTGIRRYLSYPTLSKSGFEISLMPVAGIDYYVFAMYTYNGSFEYIGSIRLDMNADVLQYVNVSGSWVTFHSDCPIRVQNNLFATMKLVVDPVAGYYTRFILNNVTYDLSGLRLRPSASSTPPSYRYDFIGFNLAAAQVNFYLDDAIMTINEP